MRLLIKRVLNNPLQFLENYQKFIKFHIIISYVKKTKKCTPTIVKRGVSLDIYSEVICIIVNAVGL